MRKIAVVIDASGSMDHFLDLFQLEGKLTQIKLRGFGGSKIEELENLTKQYDHVYFFTDEFLAENLLTWMKILDSKITIINVQKE